MKKFVINPELNKKIEDIEHKNPKIDQDAIIDQLSSDPALRMKKDAIKNGVAEYYRLKQKKQANNKAIVVDQGIKNNNENYGLDKMKKKVKKNAQFEIQFQDKKQYQFENLGGISSALSQIHESIINPISKYEQFKNTNLPIFKGFIITGPVGSGKTLTSMCILSRLKKDYQFSAYSINIGSLLSNDSEDKIRKIFQEASNNQPSIILFDDLDLLCQKQTSRRPQGSPISFFLSEIDKIKQERIYMIGTSSTPEKIDLNLRKLNRFEKMINIDMNGDQSRFEILCKLLQKVNHKLSMEQIQEIANVTSGYMAADLQLLIKQSTVQFLNSDLTKSEKQLDFQLHYEHIKFALKNTQPLMKKEGFTDIPTTTLNDIGGLEQLKLQLQREIIIPIHQQNKFKEMNFDVQSGGVLLYGPPGCGKTMLAKAIANAVKANFIIVKGPELLNKYVGESEQAVREVFGRAQRAAPCVIFFDQFDALAPKRSDQGNQVSQRVVNTLLTALDGVEERKMVFVIAATNRKDMIDEATLRSGRIQKHLYVPQPNTEQRVQILKAITKNISIEEKIDFSNIAEKSQGFSGADLRYLVKQAVVSAVTDDRKKVTLIDLNKALEQFLITRQKQKIDTKRTLQEEEDSEDNDHYKFKADLNKSNNDGIIMQNKQPAHQKKSNKKLVNNIMEEFMEFMVNKASSLKQKNKNSI